MSLTTYVNINFSNNLTGQPYDKKIEALKWLQIYLITRSIPLGYGDLKFTAAHIDVFLKPENSKQVYTPESIREYTESFLQARQEELYKIGERLGYVDPVVLDDAFDEVYGKVKAFEGFVIAGHLTQEQERYVQLLGFQTITSPVTYELKLTP